MTPTRGTQWNYTCSNKGLLLPLVSEYTWSIEFRVVVYLIGMLECFLGVAIVADIFMCAIEKITSRTKIITRDVNGQSESVEVKVWNDTVANLTLMALGSSAPEIILTTYETFGNHFEPGELGPGSVVGAAGFNLLIITAACIIAIPKGEVRRIKSIKVYVVTTFFGFFAYVWLLMILVVYSPETIELWEACLTLAFFPIMVLLAYAADRNFFIGRGPGKEMYEFQTEPEQVADQNSMIDMLKRIRKDPGLTETDAACLAARQLVNQKAHSRMWYRVGAIRKITGGKRPKPALSSPLKKIYNDLNSDDQDQTTKEVVDSVSQTNFAVIEFVKSSVAAWENVGNVAVEVRRSGKLDVQTICSVETYDGTAKSGEDYVSLKETITFRPFEEVRTVNVIIIDDNQWEEDENFFLKLIVEEETSGGAVIGKNNIMEVIILDDDNPGSIQFGKESNYVKFSNDVASVPVYRTKGADGLVTVRWQTLDQTAVARRNYQKSEGEIIFQHGETKRDIDVVLFGGIGREGQDLHFQVELLDTTGGAVLGEIRKANVHITDDQDFHSVLKRVKTLTQFTMESSDIINHTWTEQLKNSLSVNGGDIENASRSDFFMHFLTFGWKVIFAFIPPTSYCGGWLTFGVALCVIGFLTAVVGDMASIFGCLIGLKDSVTAITFVALGTSLPDLFASKSAACHEKYADSAVGNVNGSNSVNVFLGLGIPWLISTIYWASKGEKFHVPKGTLGFSVAVYGACSVVCISLLMARRYLPQFGKAELGGTRSLAILSSIICIALWLFYVLISSFEAYGYINV